MTLRVLHSEGMVTVTPHSACINEFGGFLLPIGAEGRETSGKQRWQVFSYSLDKNTLPDSTGGCSKEDEPMFLNTSYRSDEMLLRRLREAAGQGVSAADLHAQRVSFIVSSVSDERTKVTPQMVEAELKKMQGEAA